MVTNLAATPSIHESGIGQTAVYRVIAVMSSLTIPAFIIIPTNEV